MYYGIRFDGIKQNFYVTDDLTYNGHEWLISHFLLLMDVYSYRELLVNNFNGHFLKLEFHAEIGFENKNDIEKAIEYIQSIYILNKIEGKI